MARAYHPLNDVDGDGDKTVELTEGAFECCNVVALVGSAGRGWLLIAVAAEKELLALLKSRGVPSICESISREINYAWAVLSGFKTLANVGNFYFACGGQAFGYNPGYDFFGANGMQLAVFALHKFVHNEHVLVPVLDCLDIYSKLHVEGALEFLAAHDAKEILMKCVRFHDNKHDVIASACRTLGSLVMNDLVKESVSSPDLVLELLGLLKRYDHSLQICRAVLIPLGFLVTNAPITATFIDGNGIALTMAAMKRYVKDTELVWHAVGTLNGLHAKTLDIRLIYSIFTFTGIPRLVEAVASHLDTEEVTVESFQLLARLAALPEAYRAINECKVLDLAYVALFAYSGTVHRHTRLAIKSTLHSFQKCALFDPRELARRERASRTDIALYALLLCCFLLNSACALYGQHSRDLVFAVRRAVVDAPWYDGSSSAYATTKTLRDVVSIADVWDFLQGPVQTALFQDKWYNGDSFADDVDSQLGIVDRTNLLLGGVDLRLVRVGPTASCNFGLLGERDNDLKWCYPHYSKSAERRAAVSRLPYFEDTWSAAPSSNDYSGTLAEYPGSGYRRFLPRLGANLTGSDDCDSRCELDKLRRGRWLDKSSRALFVRFNLYNAPLDLHCVVQLLFEFGVATAGSAEGGGGEVIASTEVTPLHLSQYPGLFVLQPRFLTELGILAGLAWFAHKQLDKLLQYRLFYFLIPSHVADFSIVVLWAAVLVLRLQAVAQAAFPMLLTLAETSDSSYVDLGASVRYLRTERHLTAACAVFMWWRLVRLAKTVKALESTVDKLERAQALLQSYAVLLVVYVLGFAHAGVLLFPSARSSFRSYSAGIATMARTLATRWHSMDLFGRADRQLFRLLFQLSTTFIVLNIVVAILRERFNSSRVRARAAAVDGLAMLELAKQQLEAHGMRVEETSFAKKLRAAATKGIKKLQHATRDLLTVSEEGERLLDLKKAWGLGQDHLQSVPEAENVKVDGDDVLSSDEASRLLASAEEYEHKLDRQIGLFSSRLADMLSRLGNFQSYLGEELGPDELVEDVSANEVVRMKKSRQDERSKLGEVDRKDNADLPVNDSPDDGSVEVQTSALPGAVLDPNEEAEAVAQTM
ncbi:TRP-like ion channel Pkd2 [Phytophthora pseudosyringae]|uniref:TRP-like ion channel Pkd2 n=1 Tax=Phytophthora pseudosyringae TaxID=221518 RepID=A0A8T1VN76_9STRA|nr:TRP-like ion channel Pkd2 [Phytophthora pseudosyringae]